MAANRNSEGQFPSDDERDLAENNPSCGGLGFGGDEFLCERYPIRNDDFFDDFFDDDGGDHYEGGERDCRE